MRLLFLFLVTVVVTSPLLHAQTRELTTLVEWMEGDYSSAAQAGTDPANFDDVRLHIQRIWPKSNNGFWLYVEEAPGNAQERPHRQQFIHFPARKDGKHIGTLYTIRDPLRFVGAWYNGLLLEGITPDSLQQQEGCTITLVKNGEAYVGGTEGKSCLSNVRGVAYATSEMTVMKEELLLWDRGYDVNDRQVSGPAKGPYRFLRVGDGPQGLRASLQQGLYYYWQHDLSQALEFFKQATQADPASADAAAYLAETLRRLDERDIAVEWAQEALVLSPCNVFAHQILADLYNPQFGNPEGNIDTTAYHLDQAYDCDPTDGDLMVDIWLDAMRRGNRDLERTALTTMVRTGYLTSGALGLARWMLAALPDSAILLTGGDMDTYPLLALQEATGYRSDVTVVNLSLMNLPWYARMIRDRRGIPLLMEDYELDTLTPIQSSEGRLFDAGQQIVARWFGASVQNAFAHPIAVAVTVDGMLYPVFDPSAPYYAGPYWTHNPEVANNAIDTAAMRKGLAAITIDDFRGTYLNPRDRSPVRRSTVGTAYMGIVQTAIAYGNALIEAGRKKEARAIANWAERFVEVSHMTDALSYVRELKQAAK